jgi:predicted enzyme involved in methoxymalonyl-ACP biosynthesis
MMSCRVLGRGFEQTFAASCLEKARALWDVPILAEYIPGPKNAQVSRFLDTLGFRLQKEDASGRRIYELPSGVPVNEFAYPIELTWE